MSPPLSFHWPEAECIESFEIGVYLWIRIMGRHKYVLLKETGLSKSIGNVEIGQHRLVF